MMKIGWLGFWLAAVFLPGSLLMGQGGFAEADADANEKVSAKELEDYVTGKMSGFKQIEALMKKLDADNDGTLSESEFENRMQALRGIMSGGTNADADTKVESEEQPNDRRKARRSEGARKESGALKIGDTAPVFTLKSLDGESETNLADFKSKKPVVLLFGSYT